MYKRILLTVVIAFSILLGGAVISEYSGTGFVNPVLAADTPPGEGLDDTNFVFDLTSITHEDIAGSSRQNWIRQGINYIFERVVGLMAATIGSLCVLVMSYGGFLILSSAGDETQYGKGKHYILYSLIGLAFTLGAYVLVSAVQLLIRSIYG
jgi:hypothetical protein